MKTKKNKTDLHCQRMVDHLRQGTADQTLIRATLSRLKKKKKKKKNLWSTKNKDALYKKQVNNHLL